MSKSRKLGGWRHWLVISVLFVASLGVAVGFLQYYGAKQGRICESLRPGLSKQELISALGAPIDQGEEEHDVRLFSFKGNVGAAGLIRAWVNPKTETVVRLRCWEDGSDTWKIDQ